LAGKAKRKEIDFAAQALIEIRSRSKLHSFLGQTQRNRTLLSNPVGNLHCFSLELIRGRHMIYQTEHKRSLGVDNLTSQNHFHRFAFAQEPGQTLRAPAAGYDAEINLRLPDG